MQLDLQSVEKVLFSTRTFQYVRISFCPKHVGNWSSSPQNEQKLSPRMSRAVYRFSRAPVAVNHRQHFFDPTGSNTTTIPDRIEKKVISNPMDACNRI